MKETIMSWPLWASVALILGTIAITVVGAELLISFAWRRTHRKQRSPHLSPDQIAAKEEQNEKVYYSLAIGINIAIFALGIPCLLIDIADIPGFNLGATIWGFQLLHFAASLETTPLDRVAGLICLGKPMFEISPGKLFYRAWGICWIESETSLAISREFPGSPEEIDKSGNDEAPRAGKFQPIRVPTGSYHSVTTETSEFKTRAVAIGPDDILNDRATFEERFMATVKLKRGKFFQFKMVVGSIEELFKRFRDISEYILKTEFAKRTPALVLEDLALISATIAKALEVMIGEVQIDRNAADFREDYHRPPDFPLGVDLEEFRITDSDPGKTINVAMANYRAAIATKREAIAASEAAREAKINEGKGLKSFYTDEGEGQKAKLTAIGQGEADAWKARALVFTENPEFASELLRNETARQVFAQQSKFVIGGDMQGLVKLIVAGSEAIQLNNKTENQGAPAPNQTGGTP